MWPDYIGKQKKKLSGFCLYDFQGCVRISMKFSFEGVNGT